MAADATHVEKRSSTIYDLLRQVRERPGMYISRLSDLELMVLGYGVALSQHHIDEGVPHMLHFTRWLRRRTNWSTSCGWASAFAEHISREHQSGEFFKQLAEFEKLTPEVVAVVELTERHQPTGERVVVGLGGRLRRPDKVDIVRYAPEPIHFLRFHYPDELEVRHLLEVNRPDGSLDVNTSVADAKGWVAAELQVTAAEWSHPS